VRWHAEGEYLVLKAVVLEILVKMALPAVKNKQPICPYLTGLCMPVKMAQPLQTKRFICPAILRHRELLLRRHFSLLVSGRDVDASFVDDKRWGTKSSRADALDDCHPFLITWLDRLRWSTSLSVCGNFHGPNDANLGASLIKLVYVLNVDAILGFGLIQ
jgi:hypothetical protein